MSEHHLSVYLNDHLAGSVAAVDLLSRLESGVPGSSVARTAADLKKDIVADQGELEALMRSLGIAPSHSRQASAWIGEKIAQIKLLLDDPSEDGRLRLFESLDILAIGIDGKRALWAALSAVAADYPLLRGVDYGWLLSRAEEQRRIVEQVRVEAAKAALGVNTQ